MVIKASSSSIRITLMISQVYLISFWLLLFFFYICERVVERILVLSRFLKNSSKNRAALAGATLNPAIFSKIIV